MLIINRTDKRRFGDWGEEKASLFLINEGYEIVRRNYRVRNGEIDIIAWAPDKEYERALCFVEVKTRSYGEGSAERATGKEKLDRLFFAARHYCLSQNIDTDKTPIRFEQVSVYRNHKNGEIEIKKYVIPVD